MSLPGSPRQEEKEDLPRQLLQQWNLVAVEWWELNIVALVGVLHGPIEKNIKFPAKNNYVSFQEN